MPQAKLFRTIRPKNLNVKAFERRMKEGLVEVEKGMLSDFHKTTRTWDHPVKFSSRTRVTSQPLQVLVWTTDRIYRFVNDGTRAHTIAPRKKGGVLAFPAKTVPKTTPRLISSRQGFKSKKTVFVRGSVRVRGITARKFDITIQKKWRPKFKQLLQQKLNQAARESGHRFRGGFRGTPPIR